MSDRRYIGGAFAEALPTLRLADTLTRYGYTAAELATLDETTWQLVASLAGVPEPDGADRERVARLLAEREHEDETDPFLGLPGVS